MDNATASDIDKTSFWWTGLCGICHPGGGPTEYNRNGDLYYKSSHPFSIDHNVLPLDQGVTPGGCQHCHQLHNSGIEVEALDRRILIDAFDETAESAPGAGDGAVSIYGLLRKVSGVDPF